MPGLAHVVGAGVAGLSAACELAASGVRVAVHEATGHAGGRCRSFHDESLGATIDNGSHLMLSGNTSIQRFLALIGARDRLTGPASARFPFLDLATGERWTVDLGNGRIPGRPLSRDGRVPGARLADYAKSLRLLNAGPGSSISEVLSPCGQLHERFWKPVSIAVLNTEPERAAAVLMKPVLRETVGRGGRACRPLTARQGLGSAFADPAVAFLAGNGAELRFRTRLRSITLNEAGRVTALCFRDGEIQVGPVDRVILAVPARVADELVPGLRVPNEHRGIVNVHFRMPERVSWAPEDPPFLGLLGGTAEWLFWRGGIVSATVSACQGDVDGRSKVGAIWDDVRRSLDLEGDAAILPPHRVIVERMATIAQTPEQVGRRPGSDAGPPGVFLAGDWTDTGLPATIEGAVRSGRQAAELAAGSMGQALTDDPGGQRAAT